MKEGLGSPPGKIAVEGLAGLAGTGENRYEVLHYWPQLPAKYSWQTTHNVAIDREGLLYVIHEGRENLKDHPSIFVFDRKGKFIRAFGNQFQGGGHGLAALSRDPRR